MNFKDFRDKIEAHFVLMQESQLYISNVAADTLWEEYLNSYPEEIRQEYNCNNCKHFITRAGGILTINDDLSLTSIWDIDIQDSVFKNVCDRLSKLNREAGIRCLFKSDELQIGTPFNFQRKENGEVIKWTHFSCLPDPIKYIGDARPLRGSVLDEFKLFKRGLETISQSALDIVLDLISQNSLYRGIEYKDSVEGFLKCKEEYQRFSTDSHLCNVYLWKTYVETSPMIHSIRNTVIGMLLVNLSEGIDIEEAVSKYEHIVAPENYKRTKSIVTSRMIKDAETTIQNLGLIDSLARRHAKIEDITVNNVIWSNIANLSKGKTNIFDTLIKEKESAAPKNLDKVEKVSVKEFISDILPRTERLEILNEESLSNRLVTLTAPENKEAPSLFKWDNGFAWSYRGNLADSSMKQRLVKYGAKVKGILRCSLAWEGYTDLDIHLIEPSGKEVCWNNKKGTGGELDLDMNGVDKSSDTPVENIIYTNPNLILEGVYTLVVHVYQVRDRIPEECRVEIECEGTTYKFVKDSLSWETNHRETICTFKYSKKNGVEIISGTSEKFWDIQSSAFQEVTLVTYSPNYWDEQKGVGNKHLFFFVKGCKNPGPIRGFFNEYLRSDLIPHRKVFEILGDRMKVEPQEDQLSGIGFSLSARGSATFRVTGKGIKRILKLNI